MVAVLFARSDSIYKSIPGCDVYDIDRDARSYNDIFPVVAHPPCRAWGRLKYFARPRPDEKDLALFAVDIVRKNGGIVEHPAYSTLWKELHLPLRNQVDSFGGYTLDINQSWFGHRAEKRTWLYIVGIAQKELPPFPIRFDLVTHTVGTSTKTKIRRPEITKSEREKTPYDLAVWLIQVSHKIFTIKYHTHYES